MKIRVLIADDEPLARRGIRTLLAGEEDVEIAGEAPDGIRAVEEIHKLSPDVVFLDAQMPGFNGFEVLEAIDATHLPLVIFVTAYDEFALRAFQANAVDYLLKPIDPERFRRSLKRTRALLNGWGREEADRRIFALLSTRETGLYAERLLVKSTGHVTVVPVAEVDWVRADDDYAELHGLCGTHLLRETLHSLETRLNPREFTRIHRSYIVRLGRVRRFDTLENGDGTAHLEDGTALPVSRTFRDNLLRSLRSPE